MHTFRSRSRAANSYDLLPPERPKAKTAAERMMKPVDFEDAEFIVLREPRQPGARRFEPVHRSVRPGNDNRGGRVRISRKPNGYRLGLQLVRKGLNIGERGLQAFSANVFSAVVALVFVLVFAMTGGLAALAGTGHEGSSREPAGFAHVTVSFRTVDGLPMMLVSGVLENHGETPLLSPRLRAEVYTGSTMVSSTLFNPRLGRIESGDSRGFQVKLPQTGGKTPDVRLSLAE
jgi:hypothetical protein